MSTKLFSDLVDQRARAYAEIHDCDYQTAFHAVLNDNPSLKAAYTGVATGKTSPEPSPKVSAYAQKAAGDELNQMVLDLLAQSEDVCDYSAALKIVIAEHPDLAKRYTHG